jgi:hypothetical protein
VAPPAGLLQIRATVGTADGFDPREDNNNVSLTSRVFDPAQCTRWPVRRRKAPRGPPLIRCRNFSAIHRFIPLQQCPTNGL